MSEQYPGGFISKEPPTPAGPYETDSAYGIWNLSQQAAYQAQGLWPTAGSLPPDAQFNYVTMLLHGDGTNGAQNNTFLDSSTNNFTITRNGNTTQGSFSPYGSNWSNYFDASGDYLDLASNAAFSFGTGDFTVEMWLYHVSNGAQRIIGNYTSSGGTEYDIEFASDGKVYFGSYSTYTQTSTAVSLNTWTHVAWVRASGVETFYINGVSAGSATRSINFSSTNGPRIAGSKDLTVNLYEGYISNLRIVKGTAVYNGTFTPSTTPLTAISGTSLLTCQSNRFVDNSSNAFSITVNGAPSVQRFNPFGTSTAYSTATIGGSGYFDGSGDYLDITASSSEFNFGTGNLTIEFWAQQLADTYYQGVACFTYNAGDPNNGYLDIELSPGRGFYISADALSLLCQSSTAVTAGDRGWHHWAICRSGTTWYLFKDGVALTKNVDTIGGANLTGTNGCIVGAQTGGAGASPAFYYFNGNICDFRVIKGTALYTSAFTPPTAPLTAVANTQLLTNFTNGAIYDNAMMNDLETVGNAQISTSVVKYGTGSLYFDGSGDGLTFPASQNTTFGTGDLTIEFWTYTASASADYDFIDLRGSSGNATALCIYQSGGFIFAAIGNSINAITATSPTANTWHHIALTRSGSSLKLFIDGVQVGSTYTDTNNYSTQNIGYIGYFILGGYNLNGYIDDLRITKGYARYTTTFTPPTAAFPNIGPT